VEEEEPTVPAGAASRKGGRAVGCRFLHREAEVSDGSEDDSAEEDASDADSDGNLKGFTVKDGDASESNHETDEELETPPALRRRQKGRPRCVDWEAAARCSPEEVMDAARAFWHYAEQRQVAAASEAETARERLVAESGSERDVEESGEEGGEEGGGDADDERAEELTGERNALVHPYSQEERAADGEADGSGEEMAEEEAEEEQEEVHAEEAHAEEADAEEGEAEGEGAVEGEAEGAAEGAESDGGEGGEVEREADGGEGGELAVAEKPWAPKITEELLRAIATQDYGVSDDRSAKLATPAIKAYNKVADGYHQTLQKRGQPLHEGYTIVKVRAARVACLPPHTWEIPALYGNSLNCVVATTHLGDACLIWQLAELCGGHHTLGRYLPYMVTRFH
jgi:hypothetical protein